MYSRVRYAVSDVVALILIFAIMTTATSSIMLWGVPYMDGKKMEARAQSVLTQFDMMSDIIKDDVISQGFSSSTVLSFTTDAGQVSLDSQGERIILYYSLDSVFNFNVSDFDDEDDSYFKISHTGEADNLDIYYLYLHDYIDPGSPDETKDSVPSGSTITASTPNKFKDAVKIEVKNAADTVIGRIWLFDTGSITYTTSSSSGTYNVIIENGGVVCDRYNDGYLSDKPNIYDRTGLLVMRIIQFKPGSLIGGSGKANYQFTVESNHSFIRENKVSIPKYFKMQIHGRSIATKAWSDYFLWEHNFGKYTEGFAEDTLYLDGNRDFTLTHTVCDVIMGVE